MKLRHHLSLLGSLAIVFAAACGAADDTRTTPPTPSPDAATTFDAGAPPAPDAARADAGLAPPFPMAPEVLSFFESFHTSRYSGAKPSAAALDEAVKQGRTGEEIALVRGLAHLWHVAESRRDPNMDGAAIQAEAISLPGWFAFAQEKQPNDPRVGCFLGTALVNAGQATQNAALEQQGFAVLDAAVAAYPEFNLFCRALAYDPLPASDPRFDKAVDSLYESLDACFGEKVDRANPDITKYLDQATSEGRKRVCWNGWIAPHNAEGFFLYFGDLLVKQGKIDIAKIVYANAKKIKEYASWPYKSILDERLGSDLTVKAALYRDADPKNDPPVGGASADRNCAYCHAGSASE